MKKIILSLVTISALSTTGVLADSTTDIAELKAMMQQMNKRLVKLEAENKRLKAETKKHIKTHTSSKKSHKHYTSSKQQEKVAVLEEKVEILEKHTAVKSKAPVLKFSGQHYLHYQSLEDANGDTTNKFGVSRNYLQVKAYFADQPKSYMRVTLDAKQNSNFDKGSLDVRVKYAFLYLDNILPATGVEIGLAHTPWLDYEEHHGWYYRAIGETFLEQHNGAHFQNSSDYGINFKTKTEYFSSELGVYNGAGYHGVEDGEGLRGEWRLTAHLLGSGKKHVHKSDTYADVSFLGSYGANDAGAGNADGDYVWYGVHGVYNQPAFLLAASYLKADKAGEKTQGDGWSVNGEFRLGTLSESLNAWNFFARYDDYTLDTDLEKESTFIGFSYKYNQYVDFIANYQEDKQDGDSKKKKYLLTTEINW